MPERDGWPHDRQRSSLRALAARNYGFATALAAIAISLWSTYIAQKSLDQQAEQLRRAQADQVLLFDDSTQFLRPESPPVDSPDLYANMYVRNYSRLPLTFTGLLVEWTWDTQSSVFFLYDLGALAPCKQYPIRNFAADALERGAAKHPDVQESGLFLYVEFTDASGEQWIREASGPVAERGIDPDYEFVPLPPAVAEDVPDCTPS